ncbi:hypothetical protein, partial [Escherichia coli]|uniref:hypothetical protein n=1 Tax=Escherichia coli TaxID=562 RepID=UPI000BDE6A0D
KQKKLIMLPSETMIWQPEFTDKILSRKPGAVQSSYPTNLKNSLYRCGFKNLLFKKLIVHIVTSQYKQWREHRYLSLLAVLCMESVIG